MPVWVEKRVVLVYHEELLAVHGGAAGIRDEGLLESALARARNLASYAAPQPSLFRLAAAYAWGLVRNHPFIDGNKRTVLVVSLAFLELNGIAVNASQEDAFRTFSRLAAGLLSEEEFAAWLENNSA